MNIDRKSEKTVHILVVGKDPANLKGFSEVFKESKLLNDIRFAGNQDEALQMIFQQNQYRETLIPDIIISDLDSYNTEVRWEF